MKIDKSKFLDSSGKPLTQALFIEARYDEKFAVYSLKDYDHEYKGVVYPSLKKLYMEMEDVTEYEFATKYLLGWQHWKHLNNNNLLGPAFEDWREELELKVRSQAIRDIISSSAQESGGFQAAKWLADKGWDKRGAGRPSKEAIQRENKVQSRLDDEFTEDVVRMDKYRK